MTERSENGSCSSRFSPAWPSPSPNLFFHIQPFPFRPHRRGVRYVGAGFHCAAALSDAAVSQAHVGKAPVRLFSGGVHLCHHQGGVMMLSVTMGISADVIGSALAGGNPVNNLQVAPFSALSWGCEHCDFHCDEAVQQNALSPPLPQSFWAGSWTSFTAWGCPSLSFCPSRWSAPHWPFSPLF